MGKHSWEPEWSSLWPRKMVLSKVKVFMNSGLCVSASSRNGRDETQVKVLFGVLLLPPRLFIQFGKGPSPPPLYVTSNFVKGAQGWLPCGEGVALVCWGDPVNRLYHLFTTDEFSGDTWTFCYCIFELIHEVYYYLLHAWIICTIFPTSHSVCYDLWVSCVVVKSKQWSTWPQYTDGHSCKSLAEYFFVPKGTDC